MANFRATIPERYRPRALCAVAVFVSMLAPAAARQTTDGDADLCATAIAETERHSQIPARLLAAVASVESGRWDKRSRRSVSWPWTVTAEGEGKFFATREKAVRAVRIMRHAGIRNIDVGCMQINLAYHPKAFASLNDAFDPATNAAYAAALLAKLRADKRSWLRAVQFYHSSNPERQTRYGDKVFKAWRVIRVREARGRLKAPRANPRRDFQRARPPEQRPKAALRRIRAHFASRISPPHGYEARRLAEINERRQIFSLSRRP